MDHEYWMRLAIEQATSAANLGEVPIGAVIIQNDTLLAKNHNRTITNTDPTAHAEVLCIRDACQQLKNHRISNSTLYITLEPCIMCLGAIIQSRIKTIVYSAADTKTGVFSNQLSTRTLSLNHHPEHLGGILSAESAALLNTFFSDRR